MQRSDETVSLPPARLVPGQDDDLIAWAGWATENGISKSAAIRSSLRVELQRRDGQDNFENTIIARLDRIEVLLQTLIQGDKSSTPPPSETFNDPLLDGAL